jgi:Tol biopolymer transport system component
MRIALAVSYVLGAGLLGCGSDGPTGAQLNPPRVVPALESVPFALLGPGKVAFERIGDGGNFGTTYIIDATAGTTSHVLDNLLMFAPNISPDGRRLTFTKFTGDATLYDTYVANVDGAGVQQVTQFPTQEGPPTWSPDGARVVVIGSDANLNYDVYSQSPVLNATDVTRLTNFSAGSNGAITCPAVGDNKSPVSMSAQGRMAFVCVYGEVDVLSADATSFASYKPSRTDTSHWPNLGAAVFSPDGTRIAMIETTSDQTAGDIMTAYSLKVMNVDGTNVTTVASVPFTAAAHIQFGGGWNGPNNASVCWMPDGSRLVFNVPESQLVGHLWVVRVDGTGLSQLTTASGAWDRSVSCSRS